MKQDDLKPLDLGVFVHVHSQIGMALWHSQAFEDTLTFFITLILKLPPSRAEAETREVLEKLQSKTLGGLIAELRKGNTTNSVSTFEQRVNRFLSERNWLVHQSWREHHGDLFDQSRLPPLLARLRAIADEAHALQDLFGKLVHQWTLAQGIDPAEIEAEMRRTLARRGVV